jgi:hypothetical protein
MASSEGPRPNYSRRFFIFALLIVLAGGLYTWGWYYFAGKLESEAERAIARINRDGVSADCRNAEARGYPFRIGLFCDGARYADARRGVAIATGPFRSAAQIYNPFLVVGELDSPVMVDLPGNGDLRLDWTNLRSSVRLARPLPERLSIELAKPAVSLEGGARLADAASGEAHLRPRGDDLDLAGRIAGLVLSPELVKGRALPPITGEVDIGLKDGVALARAGFRTLRGASGEIRTLSASGADGEGVSLTGPFSISADGLIDARLTLEVRNPQALSTLLQGAIPEFGKQIKSGFAGLAALGDKPTLPLTIKKGRATLGFIRLGDIPPL